jgi:hypothetical protein
MRQFLLFGSIKTIICINLPYTLACKADILTSICLPNFLENLGASMSHNPMGLHGLLQGNFKAFS